MYGHSFYYQSNLPCNIQFFAALTVLKGFILNGEVFWANNGKIMVLGDVVITAPANWQGHRYTFDGSTWTEIPAWTIRTQARIDELESEIAELSAISDRTDRIQGQIDEKET